MKTKNCAYTKLLSVHEAITLIILSLIYPETKKNKPTICALKKGSHLNIEIDYNQSLTFSYLESVLFKVNICFHLKYIYCMYTFINYFLIITSIYLDNC